MLADEVATALRAADCARYLDAMYGDQPDRWDPGLSGLERLRFITNCFTRIRYCDAGGHLDFGEKGPPVAAPAGMLPWYAVPDRRNADLRIVFGHWSTLRMTAAESRRHHVYALDTGAVWGGALTAMRLEDGRTFQVKSQTTVAFD
jgi:bis(5'-nucleosyl)-tetraphosphatase (symmetrical)